MNAKQKQILVRLPKDLAHAAKVKAAENDRSLTSIVAELLKNWVSKSGAPPAQK